MTSSKEKKHRCPDCKMCQWCSERRCEMCKGWLIKPYEEVNSHNSIIPKCNGKRKGC